MKLIEEDIKSQRERCHEMHVENRKTFIATLSSSQRVQIVDNHATLASQWLLAVQHNTYSTLSKAEIAVDLSYRTLKEGHHEACKYCFLVNDLGHNEACTKRPNGRTARHASFKKTIAYHVKQIEGTTVKEEPALKTTKDRTDLRVTGPGSYLQASPDYDVAIISVNAENFPALRVSQAGEDDLFDATQKQIEHFLLNIEQQKNRHYCALTESAFHPMIFTSAGTPSPTSHQVWKHWRDLMERAVYKSLLMDLSISLLRPRSRIVVL